MNRLMLALSLLAVPTTAWPSSLDAALENYVVAFDNQALNDEARHSLQRIIDNPGLSHASKVVNIHTVLERNKALLHVDIHGAPLDAPEQSSRVSEVGLR
ncbi:MAG: hypothetical protein AAFW87_01805 [Pseudomonadota bacterium]